MSLLLLSCAGSKYPLETRPSGNNYFSGLLVIDAATGDTLVSYNATHYFTPASTLKLFTLFTARNVLPDSVATLHYAETENRLYFTPQADPSFLHDSLPNSTFEFLNTIQKELIMVPDSFPDFKYGLGWQWDDYEFYYMPEKSLFPLYGNLVRLYPDGKVVPSFFLENVEQQHPLGFSRDFMANVFYLNGKQSLRKVPFITSQQLSVQLLTYTLHRPLYTGSLPDELELKPYISTPLQPVYKRLMDESENFIAEQLLLMVAKQKTGVYKVENAIEYALDSLLPELPQKPRWVDGSGLSRYNMFTPADMVYVLNKMYREWDKETVYSLLPYNGKEGRLYHWYPSEIRFIHAKTGSLSNHHNLCGYLDTKNGKTLIFSYMNNNFNIPSQQVKDRINAVLHELYEKY
jgi:D-alanyl-D-alanine carboxypeptidase/D-alanyl-D-alanine-endopeptidase (penicillin-binding protein 4)